MHGGAVVVEQPGHGQFAAACAAADGIGGFQDGDAETGLAEGDGGGQTVGARSYDVGVCRHFRVPPVRWNQPR
ncbi:hypothetical protein GCM10009574_067560 [Streptomyces asiaticus]|uniref:Uncharacterized protein n=2 Tax=Streptomyces rhizosphaericus TaxID=114699 RepID=A0ABN3EEB8_9ACTN